MGVPPPLSQLGSNPSPAFYIKPWTPIGQIGETKVKKVLLTVHYCHMPIHPPLGKLLCTRICQCVSRNNRGPELADLPGSRPIHPLPPSQCPTTEPSQPCRGKHLVGPTWHSGKLPTSSAAICEVPGGVIISILSPPEIFLQGNCTLPFALYGSESPLAPADPPKFLGFHIFSC